MGSVKKSSCFTLPFWRIGKTVQNEQTEPAGGYPKAYAIRREVKFVHSKKAKIKKNLNI